jgi:hypothetical protein
MRAFCVWVAAQFPKLGVGSGKYFLGPTASSMDKTGGILILLPCSCYISGHGKRIVLATDAPAILIVAPV